MMSSRYGRIDNCPDWELICQVGEYDIYISCHPRDKVQKMLFVWGVHSFQKITMRKEDVLHHFEGIPYICAWFRMSGYDQFPGVEAAIEMGGLMQTSS